jgi:hypothetical protein
LAAVGASASSAAAATAARPISCIMLFTLMSRPPRS